MTAATIHELSQTVRDTIFDPLVEHIFLESNSLRYQVTSCLDTIEDAQMAIDVFRLLDPSSDQADKGSLYLAIYGVFQGVILQQDALMNLAKALCFPFRIADFPVLEEVREIRNRIVGHPTSYKRKRTESYYAISKRDAPRGSRGRPARVPPRSGGVSRVGGATYRRGQPLPPVRSG